MNKSWDIGYLYDEVFEKEGDSYKSLLWGGQNRQFVTYRTICQEIDFNGTSILDVGCGFGDFYEFLYERTGWLKRYVGIDIKKEFVDIARKRYCTGPELMFACCDIDSMPKVKVDYALAIGTLATKDIFDDLIPKMWKIADLGIVFTCLSDIDYKGSLVSYHPDRILATCFVLSPHVVMRHDYGEQEATFFVFRKERR
ncbi:MAG: class I SAM-dependent methyltransferase [Thermodesulfobacteriota bacterium]